MKESIVKTVSRLLLIAACLTPISAVAFPNKPIQVVVPYGAGGAVDIHARIVTEHMSRTLGQPIVVVNRPGGAANIGPTDVAKSARDGYTLLASSTATALNPLIYKSPGWKSEDLVPIVRTGTSPSLIVVSNALGVKNLQEFIALAKAKPGELATPVTGLGSAQAMGRENFAHAAGIKFMDVGYKGGTSFLADLIAGRLAVSVSPLNVVIKQVEQGSLVALANTAESRSPAAPNIATIGELGFPQATSESWFGLHAPAGTPEPVLQALANAAEIALADPAIQKHIRAVGAEPAFLARPQFAVFLGDEQERGKRFLKNINHVPQ